MKRSMLILATTVVVLIGVSIAEGTNHVPDRLPVGETRRQLDEYEAKLEQQQIALAACMAQRGFDYIPHLPADWVMERAALLDYAAGGTGDIDVDAPPDPNLKILAGFTSAEVNAYQVAYWGDDSTAGCYDITYEKVFGISPRAELARLAAVADQVDAAVASDPRIAQATASFISCMDGRGFAVTDVNDVFRQTDARRIALEREGQAAGITPDQVPGYVEYVAFENAIYEAYSACIGPYRIVEDGIRSEYVERFLHQP